MLNTDTRTNVIHVYDVAQEYMNLVCISSKYMTFHTLFGFIVVC